MRQSCEDVYCARNAKCQIEFTGAINLFSLLCNLIRKFSEVAYCARDAKCQIEFMVAIKSVLPALQSHETVL
jgi:hypothetical protein